MVSGLPDQEDTKCGDRQTRLRETEQERKARLHVKREVVLADVCRRLLGSLQDAAALLPPLYPLTHMGRKERGLYPCQGDCKPDSVALVCQR